MKKKVRKLMEAVAVAVKKLLTKTEPKIWGSETPMLEELYSFDETIEAKSTPVSNLRDTYKVRQFTQGVLSYFNGKYYYFVGPDKNGEQCSFKILRSILDLKK